MEYIFFTLGFLILLMFVDNAFLNRRLFNKFSNKAFIILSWSIALFLIILIFYKIWKDS